MKGSSKKLQAKDIQCGLLNLLDNYLSVISSSSRERIRDWPNAVDCTSATSYRHGDHNWMTENITTKMNAICECQVNFAVNETRPVAWNGLRNKVIMNEVPEAYFEPWGRDKHWVEHQQVHTDLTNRLLQSLSSPNRLYNAKIQPHPAYGLLGWFSNSPSQTGDIKSNTEAYDSHKISPYSHT